MPKKPKGAAADRAAVGKGQGVRKNKLPRNGRVPVRVTKFLDVVAPELSLELREQTGRLPRSIRSSSTEPSETSSKSHAAAAPAGQQRDKGQNCTIREGWHAE